MEQPVSAEIEKREMAPHGPGFERHRRSSDFDDVLMGTPFTGDPDRNGPENQVFHTGAKRGTDHEDCYLHLIPPEALYAYGRAFAEGAKKYGLHNWLKGFPFSVLMNHAQHHLLAYMGGDRSEDHLGHAIWNIGAMIYFQEHRPELNDLPPYKNFVPQGLSTQESKGESPCSK